MPVVSSKLFIMIRNLYIIVTFCGLIYFSTSINKSELSKYSNSNFCPFNNPDTSVSGIILRDANSTIQILGKHINLEGDSTHNFYSKAKDQILSMTVHAGDYRSQVSIFKIRYNLTKS